MRKFIPLLICVLSAASVKTDATTVIPPTFDQLVDRAEMILQGTVTEVQPQWTGEGAQRHIVTYVTFQVEEALKGTPGGKYTIRMFGGEIAGEGMAIADAPQFHVGDQEIVFIENNGSQLIPLVGMMFGRFHVRQNEAGQEIVTTNENEPVTNVPRFGQPAPALAAANEPDVTSTDFKAAVRKHIEEVSTDHPTQ